MFLDRFDAGRALAATLRSLVAPPALVVAVPRGGVAVALPIAAELDLPLALVHVRKLAAPGAPEAAFGAVDEEGETSTEPSTLRRLRLDPADVRRARATAGAEIRRRLALYGLPPLAARLPGVAVVLVDDGVATGLTLRAALLYARRHGAREVIVATPCAPASAAERFRRAADLFVALDVTERVTALRDHYRDFPPLSDDDVLALVARGSRTRAGLAGPA